MDTHITKLEGRIGNLEKDVSTVKTDLAVIRSNYATKADVELLKTSIESVRAEFHKWMFAAMISVFLSMAGLFFALTTVLKPALLAAPPAPAAAVQSR